MGSSGCYAERLNKDMISKLQGTDTAKRRYHDDRKGLFE